MHLKDNTVAPAVVHASVEAALDAFVAASDAIAMVSDAFSAASDSLPVAFDAIVSTSDALVTAMDFIDKPPPPVTTVVEYPYGVLVKLEHIVSDKYSKVLP